MMSEQHTQDDAFKAMRASQAALQQAMKAGAVYAWSKNIAIERITKDELINAAFGNKPNWQPVGIEVPNFADVNSIWRIADENWIDHVMQVGDPYPRFYRKRRKADVRNPDAWSTYHAGNGHCAISHDVDRYDFQTLFE